MTQLLDPNGLSQRKGVSEVVRKHGKGFALELARCHKHFLAGDYDYLDNLGQSHYATSCCSMVFALPKGSPWFAVTRLLQELES